MMDELGEENLTAIRELASALPPPQAPSFSDGKLSASLRDRTCQREENTEEEISLKLSKFGGYKAFGIRRTSRF